MQGPRAHELLPTVALAFLRPCCVRNAFSIILERVSHGEQGPLDSSAEAATGTILGRQILQADPKVIVHI